MNTVAGPYIHRRRKQLTLGEPADWSDRCITGECGQLAWFGRKRITINQILTNAPCPEFVQIKFLKIGPEDILVEDGADAFIYNAVADCRLDLPSCDPGTIVSFSCRYGGLVPKEFIGSRGYEFRLAFKFREHG
jgi:hypothetical protein